MVGSRNIPHGRRHWRWAAVVTSCVAVAGGALWASRSPYVSWATAQPPALSTPSPKQAPVPAPAAPAAEGSQAPQTGAVSDYTSRVVAYVHGTQPITRQDLGEYLIARHGAAKLPLLLNKKIIEAACRARSVSVTPAEVESSFAEELKNLKLDQATFVKTVLPRYKKNLFEWKEDTLRPRLMLTKLCQKQVSCSEEELKLAFEATYGPKIECRMILWPLDQQEAALKEYNQLASSEEAFVARAKKQPLSELSATGGKIKPFGRGAMGDPNLESKAFALKLGEVSELIKTSQGHVILKCDRHIPADTTVSIDSVRAKMMQELTERKVAAEMANIFQVLRDQAKPQPLLKEKDRTPEGGPVPAPTQVVAYVHGTQEVTREELGEFLIARYGAEKLELLVNRRVIDGACKEKGIAVTEAEIDAAMESDLKALKVDQTIFVKEFLSKWNKTLYEWREDALRPKLLLAKLAKSRATCTEDDIKKGFEAYYGEKVELRVILYPTDQAKFALEEYPKIRDSEEEFARKARSQPSATLAAKGGKLDQPIGRYMLGDETLEREAFKLQPGEVSMLIGTPQGQVVLKCDKRIPADKTVTLEQKRDEISKEVFERKVQMEMSVVFKEMRDKAAPRLLLKDPNRPEDLAGDAARLLSETPLPAEKGQASLPSKGK